MSDVPQKDDEDRDPLDLLAEQFLAEVRKGDNVTPEGFAARHAAVGPELRDLCETLLMLEGCKRDRETSATGGRKLVLRISSDSATTASSGRSVAAAWGWCSKRCRNRSIDASH